MLEKIKYINNQNEVVEFGDGVIFANYNDLRDYSWDYDTDFNQITNFRRSLANKSLPIIINARTEEEGILLKNKIFEVFEKDILMNKKGKFIIGDYYYKCFIVESKSTDYLIDKELLYKTISIVTDEPYWIKESNNIFKPGQGVQDRSFYDYDYPYGYSNNLGIRDINNSNFIDSDIRIVIYGPVTNPTIYIKGHQYKVNTELLAGEYLTIDTKDKTIIKTKVNGKIVNEFHKRDRAYNIFEKISPGNSFVSWDETFTFEIVVVEERSEPKWT